MHLCFDPILREIAVAVPVIDDAVRDALASMAQMMESQNGVGLAAPQVGIGKRFFVMKDVESIPKNGKLSDAPVLKMINPVITARSPDTIVWEEGCLSILGSDDLPVYADVVRPERVTIEWTDENGVAHNREFTGYSARIAQHELDHLDGILFIDHLPQVKRELVMNKVKKRKKNF